MSRLLREGTESNVKAQANPLLMCFKRYCFLSEITLQSIIFAITNFQKRKLPQSCCQTKSWKDFLQHSILNMSLFCRPIGIMTPHGQFKRGTSVA